MPVDDSDLEAAAAQYASLLPERIDLVHLGLGPDGHTASLFPGTPQLAVRDRRVTSGPAGLEPFVERVTLTIPALAGAVAVAFLVTGASKADAVARAFRAEPGEDVPASLLRLGAAPIDVYLDEPAAAEARDPASPG